MERSLPLKRRLLTLVFTLPLALLAGLLLLYAGGQGGTLPWWRVVPALGAALLIVLAPLHPRWRSGLAISAAFLLVALLWWGAQRPQADRAWVELFEREARLELDGSLLHIGDVRDFRHAADGSWEAGWYDRTWNLEQLEGADFVLSTFGGVPGVGHAMVSFRFVDGHHLAVSVEARREQGERYSVLGGAFRQFELYYVWADERDALALRTHGFRDPVWIIPIHAGVPATRAFLLDMVERSQRLSERPEWYQTFVNSCATNLADHYERINDLSLPPDYRVLLPGFSETLIEELDLLPEGVSAAEARSRFQVDPSFADEPVDVDYSARVRERLGNE